MSLRIDWRAVLHSYTLKLTEEGEVALRLAIRKLNASQTRLKTIRPWLGTVIKVAEHGGPGIVEPASFNVSFDRQTVMKSRILYKPSHCWPQSETTLWRPGMDVLCWSRSGEQHVSVMMAKPLLHRYRCQWPALAVMGAFGKGLVE